MVRPDLYEAAVRLVRGLADLVVAGSDDPAALLDIDARALLDKMVADQAPLPPELDLDLIVGAALALADREVRQLRSRREQEQRLREAHEQGATWVVLDRQGPAEGPVAAGFGELALHLPSGHALHRWVAQDPDTGRDAFHLDELRLDPATGLLAEDQGGLPETVTLPDQAAWEAAAAARRAALEASP